MNNKIYQIQKQDIPKAAETLKLAFADDPLISWIFGSKEHFLANSQDLIETWVRYCVYYGLAYRTEQFESVSLRKLPGDVKSSLWKMFRAGMLKTPRIMGKEAFHRLMYFDDLSIRYKKKLMAKRLFLYCWQLGTKPQYQHQGFGRLLMDKTFAMAKKFNVPCYLETASKASKKIHERAGYQILDEILLPDSQIQITMMLNELK